MATKLIGVVNLTSSPLQLTNTLKGVQRKSDATTLNPLAYTKTGGADGNFIEIPDATPLAKWFESNFTAISGIPGGATINFAKVGGSENNTVHWAINGFSNDTTLSNTATFDRALAIVGVDGTGQPQLWMIPSPV